MSELPRVLSLISAFALPLLAGCSQDVTLPFKARVRTQAFACNQAYDGLGTTGSRYEPRDFRLYVHDVRLVDEDGQEVAVELTEDAWQHEGVALLDFEDKSGLCENGTPATNLSLRGTVPAGQYRGLRFTLGVPESLNHQDAATAPAPLNVSTLFWRWEDGYKFLRLDGRTTGLPNGHSLHLGSTGCVKDGSGQQSTCSNPNRISVSLPDFDPEKSAVVLDVAELLASSNLDANTANTAPGCMSAENDPECLPLFHRMGLPFHGEAAPGAQSFIRME